VSLASSNKIVLSGMRVSGKLHLGHYHGVLKNWLKLQEAQPCYFFAADLHGLTTHYANPAFLQEHIWAMLVDWLAVGIDPTKATLFIQSQVHQHAELNLLLSMNIPLPWLERVPTYKDQIQKLSHLDLQTYGFLGYPVLMSADILLYKANCVPVGEDQLPHVELVREIARRFNHLYGTDILKEPQALLTPESKFPGLDGQKMSKSYDNTINLRDAPDVVAKKIKTMPTDPARVKRTDPGEPTKCPVWEFHQIYSDATTQEWVQTGCRSAGIGCIECKQPVIEAIQAELKPLQERIAELESDPTFVRRVLAEGTEKAKEAAEATMQDVKKAMGLMYT
jgi:tryptophanyl-tRNA synthetase